MAEISKGTENIHCMLDILMSRSNDQVRGDEINESVIEKKIIHRLIVFVYSELSKYKILSDNGHQP